MNFSKTLASRMFARSSLSSSCSSSLGSHPSFTTHAHRCVSSLGSSSILYTKSRSSAKYAGFNGTPVQTNQNNSSGRSRSRVFFSASAAAPPPLPTIDMAFQEFPAVRRAGGLDTPLIILHGMLGSSSNWRSIAQNPNFSTNRRVFACDLRNHGSSPHSEVFSIQDLGNDICQFMDKHGLEKAIILGHSLGGKAAMACGLLHPDRVEKLVIADISPVNYNSYGETFGEIGHIIRSLHELDIDGVKNRKHADDMLKAKLPMKGIRDFTLQNLVSKADGEGWTWRCNLQSIMDSMPQTYAFHFSPDEGHVFEGPTLFVAGQKSDYIKPEHHAVIDEFFPANQHEVIPKAGHWVHAENPHAFINAVGKFIRE